MKNARTMLAIIAIGWWSGKAVITAQPQPAVQQYALVEQLLALLDDQYYDTLYGGYRWEELRRQQTIAPADLNAQRTALQTLLHTLNDPNAHWLTPAAARTARENLHATDHNGYGLTTTFHLALHPTAAYLEVIAPIVGSAADRANIRPRDRIVRIDGLAISSLSLSEISEMLTPAARFHPVLRLEVEREGSSRRRVCTLRPRSVENTAYPFSRVIRHKGRLYGIVWVPQFSEGSSFRVAQAIRDMEKSGIDHILLDLRHNAGGFMGEGRNLMGFFMGEKPIAFNHLKSSAIQMFNSVGKQQSTLPLAVLVNEGTASVAELVAGGLQTSARHITIFGTPTAKRGWIYSFFELEDASAVVLPVGWVELLNRQSISQTGVAPDVLLRWRQQQFALHNHYRRDRQLLETLNWLSDKKSHSPKQ